MTTEFAALVGSLLIALVIWMDFLAIFCIRHDSALTPVQKWANVILVLFGPIFGACFVLYMAHEHHPEAVPEKWIPWPLRSLVFAKPIPPNPHRDEYGHHD